MSSELNPQRTILRLLRLQVPMLHTLFRRNGQICRFIHEMPNFRRENSTTSVS